MVYIWLNKVDKLWYTTDVDNPKLLSLFGTDTLPTPFSEATPLETVLATLRARNPTHIFHYSPEAAPIKNLFDPHHYDTKEALLETCVLHVLQDEGRFNFELQQQIQHLLGATLLPGKLEPILNKLVLDGLVSKALKAGLFNGSLVAYYSLTPWGEQHLKDKVDKL
jgi:hypothetical protein